MNDTGNTELSDGAEVEASTDVVSAVDCPEALSIYKVDETGAITTD